MSSACRVASYDCAISQHHRETAYFWQLVVMKLNQPELFVFRSKHSAPRGLTGPLRLSPIDTYEEIDFHTACTCKDIPNGKLDIY